jgi:hypothetical protein
MCLSGRVQVAVSALDPLGETAGAVPLKMESVPIGMAPLSWPTNIFAPTFGCQETPLEAAVPDEVASEFGPESTVSSSKKNESKQLTATLNLRRLGAKPPSSELLILFTLCRRSR